MKSCEALITPDSDYYLYSPSAGALEMFFYPICSGHFTYLPGYRLERSSYDSFLLMYVTDGSLTREFDQKETSVSAGFFVLIDCYRPHAYRSDTGWKSYWCHFDGPTARAYYQTIISRAGNVFCLPNPAPAVSKLISVFETFQQKQPVREAQMSKYLTDILTSFLLYSPSVEKGGSEQFTAETVTAYISEHFSEDLPVSKLAKLAGLSQYHFIRMFRKETGFTPHEYLTHTRLNTARYLLKTTRLSVKDICFQSGFSSESVFCSAFRRHTGMTPTEYRQSPSAPAESGD